MVTRGFYIPSGTASDAALQAEAAARAAADDTKAPLVSVTPQVITWTGGTTVSTGATAGAWVDLDPNGSASARPTDLVFANCVAGQWVRVNVSDGLWGAEASVPLMTLYTYKAGVQTRNLGSATTGVGQWGGAVSVTRFINGTATFQIQAGDINTDGSVRLRWCYRQGAATAKTFYIGSAGYYFRAEGYGPF